ncbi:MAG TPA: FAD-dependent oxidoreductase [Thermodesulfobacteriota bacterium]|nr:FAD-dependent oxidoreductase [Thermodesulfobacteriota bacterium]
MKRKPGVLFEPLRIGSLEIKNRIAMAPVNLTNLYPQDGTFPPRVIDYYTERARGGVGLIMTGVFKVEDEVENYQKNGIRIWPIVTPKALPGIAELADRLHNFGTKFFVQLSAGPGRVARGDAIDAGFQPVSASPNPAFFRPEVTCRELREDEIERIIEAFGRAAQMLATVGVDGVEIHGHEGYLIDQFNTALWNKRSDRFGGDLRGRLTLAVEVLRRIRKAAGPGFPVSFRYTVKHFIRAPWKSYLKPGDYAETGRDIAESFAGAEILQEAGYDALHVDAGSYEGFYWAHPPAYQPEDCATAFIQGLKKRVSLPIIAAGKLGNPRIAERAVAEGATDVVALGRPLLADPQWAQKVFRGAEEEVRPCIGCHEGCFRLPAQQSKPATCSVNPACGRERNYPAGVTARPRKVLVIGGGVAGMEAARTSALRGHRVVLFEMEESLGGHLRAASVPDFRADLRKLLTWYRREIERLPIEVHLNREATPQIIAEADYDAAVLAAGAVPAAPDIPGIDQEHVATWRDVLSGKRNTGEEILVLGGGVEGCETAVWLGRKGKKVRIVEPLDAIASNIHPSNRQMLMDMMEDLGVEVILKGEIARVDKDAVTILHQGETRRLDCRSLVLASGLTPVRSLWRYLNEKGTPFHVVGDCQSPRGVHYAILDGFNVGQCF